MFDYDPPTRPAVPIWCLFTPAGSVWRQVRTPLSSRVHRGCGVRGAATRRVPEGMRLPAAADADSDFLHAMRVRRDALAAELDRMDADIARFSAVTDRRPDPDASRDLLNISQAARYLGLSRGTVHELIRRAELGQVVVDVGFAVAAVGGNDPWFPFRPSSHPLDGRFQPGPVDGVAGLDIVVEDDAVDVVADLGLVAELDRFPILPLRIGRASGSCRLTRRVAPSGIAPASRSRVCGAIWRSKGLRPFSLVRVTIAGCTLRLSRVEVVSLDPRIEAIFQDAWRPARGRASRLCPSRGRTVFRFRWPGTPGGALVT